jgi:acetylcholinesterase
MDSWYNPSIVFNKGGGFEIGAGSDAMYNGAHLVEESLKRNQPVISISFNYRLTFFGFLASKELEKDNGTYVGNYGNSSHVVDNRTL